jgi:regulator of RNase E activity RraA
VSEIRSVGLPLYCRAITPRGPHKGHGGTLDAPAAVGGVAVLPGDLVVGDDDGVVVVPLSSHTEVLAEARQRLSRESEYLKGVAAGRTTVELLGLAEAELVEL